MNLRVEQLSYAYRPGPPVLRDLSLTFRAGRVTGVFGANGCGKSTLLRCLNGSARPQTGGVWLGDREASTLRPRDLARIVAVVAQDTPVVLPFRALDVVLLGRYPHGDSWRADSPADLRLARDCLARLDLEGLAERPFEELSGGERQRVIVARALAQQTPVLLWDEPAAHLDIRHQLQLYRLARALAGEGRTLVMVCHDLLLAPLSVDDAVLLADGRVLAHGPVAEVLSPARLARAFGVGLRITWPAPDTVSLQLADSGSPPGPAQS